MQARVLVFVFLSDNVGWFKLCLTGRKVRRMVRHDSLISVVNILGYDVAFAVITLSEHTASIAYQVVGWTVLIARIGGLLLVVPFTFMLGVPGIPLGGVIDLVGQDITRVMTKVIGRAEHEVEINILLFLHMIDFGVCIFQSRVFIWQIHCTGRNNVLIVFFQLTVCYGDIGILHEESLLRLGQQIPVPIADGVVLVVLDIVDDHLLIILQHNTRSRIVGIAVRHHIQQLHGAMRGRRDGQWDVYTLTIGIGRTSIGGDVLVVDIYRTLDEPVVSRHGVIALILAADVIAVVDDDLCAMYEVTGRFPFHIGAVILEVSPRNGILVQSCQRAMFLFVV